MIKISVLAMLMGIWGWWAFEIFTFMATYLGETEAAAQTQMRSIGLLTFMLPVGYSGASGILTGNAIGASKPKLAITYYKVCMVAALHVISNGEPRSLLISSPKRFSMSGLTHQLATSQSQLITQMSGSTGGKMMKMWNSISSWAKTTSLSIQ